MTDLSTLMGTDPEPGTTQPVNAVPGLPDANVTPAGVHPLDQSVPMTDSGQLLEPDKPPSTDDDLGPQGRGRSKPWGTSNETAFPVNQRAAHDWFASTYTVGQTNPLLLAGRLKGCKKTRLSIPAVANVAGALPLVVAQDEGDVNQGAGIIIYPGETFDIDSEGPVFAAALAPNAAGGPVRVVRLTDPPGGGLGLSSS